MPDETKKSIPVRLIIPPRITNVLIEVGETKISDAATEVLLVDGDQPPIKVSYVQDEEAPPKQSFSLKIDDTKVIGRDGAKLVTKDFGSASVTVLAGEDIESKIGEFKVDVQPAIKSIIATGAVPVFMSESSSDVLKLSLKDIKNRDTLNFSRVKCDADESLKKMLSVVRDADGLSLRSGKLADAKPIDGKVICEVDKKRSNESGPLSVSVIIQPKKGYLTIDSLNGTTLLPNGTLTFLINVFGEDGTPQGAGITYRLEKQTDKQWVSLSEQGTKLLVNWVDLPDPSSVVAARPSAVTIQVEAKNNTSGTYPIRGTITVRMGGTVTRFSSLKVKLNVMDERTVRDLYGKVMSDDYYALMVRLFNDLKDEDPNKNAGQSILAYSSSVEIAVGLEKQFDGSSESGIEVWKKDKAKDEKSKWASQNQATIDKVLPTVKSNYDNKIIEFNELMRKASEKDLIALEAEARTRTDRSRAAREKARRARGEADAAHRKAISLREQIRTYFQDNLPPLQPFTYRPDVAIDDGKWYPASRDDLIRISEQEAYLSDDDHDSNISAQDNEPNCVDTITYRPFTFEMMVNTVDRREERTFRSRLFKILNLVSFGASTITAVAVPAKGSDLPLGIEKFGNVLIPGLDELYPDLKEQHRQNIVAQAMKPIEEIPFGSDITRVIFIPKKSIRGLITAHKARISLICPFYFKVKVAVITKGADITLGGQRVL